MSGLDLIGLLVFGLFVFGLVELHTTGFGYDCHENNNNFNIRRY